MNSRKCQTSTATPAKPGVFLFFHNFIDLHESFIDFWQKGEAQAFLEQVFRHQGLLIGLYSTPLQLILIYHLLADGALLSAVWANPWYEYLLFLTVSGFLIFLATGMPALSVFGECERYFEYSAPFFSILSVGVLAPQIFLDNSPLAILVILQISILLAIFYFRHQPKYQAAFRPPGSSVSENNVVSALAELTPSPRVAVLPPDYAFALASRTSADADVKYLLHWVTRRNDHRSFLDVIDHFDYMEKLENEFNDDTINLAYVQKEFGVNCVVLFQDLLNDQPEIRQQLMGAETVYQDEQFLVLRLPSPRPAR